METKQYRKASVQYRCNVCSDRFIEFISNANPKHRMHTHCCQRQRMRIQTTNLASAIFQNDNEWNDVRRTKITHNFTIADYFVRRHNSTQFNLMRNQTTCILSLQFAIFLCACACEWKIAFSNVKHTFQLNSQKLSITYNVLFGSTFVAIPPTSMTMNRMPFSEAIRFHISIQIIDLSSENHPLNTCWWCMTLDASIKINSNSSNVLN